MSDARINLKWLAIGFGGLVVAAAAVMLLLVYQADARLEQKLAELRAAGEPTTIADLARPAIPTDENAETYLRRAEPAVKTIRELVAEAVDAQTPADRAAFEALLPSGELLDTMRAALAANPAAAPFLDQASRCPDYDPGLNWGGPYYYEFLESLSLDTMYDAQRVLVYEALVQVAGGRREQALQTCLAMFRLSRLAGNNPTAFGKIISISFLRQSIDCANVVLRAGTLSPSAHDELETELASLDLLGRFAAAIHEERAFELQTFGQRVGEPPPKFRLRHWLVQDKCDYIDASNQALRLAREPYDVWRREVDALIEHGQVGSYTEQALGTIDSCHLGTFVALARLRALRVLNALEARGAELTAGEVELNKLGLPADATVDPFNGKPLIVKRLPEGWLIYSVGSNLSDGGGDLGTDNYFEGPDVGVRPPVLNIEPATEQEQSAEGNPFG